MSYCLHLSFITADFEKMLTEKWSAAEMFYNYPVNNKLKQVERFELNNC